MYFVLNNIEPFFFNFIQYITNKDFDFFHALNKYIFHLYKLFINIIYIKNPYLNGLIKSIYANYSFILVSIYTFY